MGKLSIYVLVLLTSVTALSATKATTAEIIKCMAKVREGKSTAFTDKEASLIIEGDLGVFDAPGTFHRDYSRDGRVLASLSYQVQQGSVFTRRTLVLNIEGIEKSKRTDFMNIVRADMAVTDYHAGLQPWHDNPDQVLRSAGPATMYLVSAGYRHPLKADEAAKLFALLNSILNARLKDAAVTDTVASAALSPSNIQF